MSFDINKEISKISKDLNEDENELNHFNSIYNQIPKNILNNPQKENNSKNKLDSLINTFEIIAKIDKIKEEENPIQKLHLLKSLFLTNNVSNTDLRQIIISKLITEDILKNIEQSLFNINYPMFNGKMLMTIYEQLNTTNKNDLEIISLYFEIYSYISNDIYKEFPNYGAINTLLLKNKDNDKQFYFMDMISEFLFKKVLATIFYNENKNNNNYIQNQNEMPGYLKKLSNQEKNFLYEYEKLISYLNKIISNTSELFSIIINKANEDKKKEFKFNRDITLKNIISCLMEKIIIFLTSEKSPLDLSNRSSLLVILLIQKTNEQVIEFIKNYQYDSFKNISLYDYIKYYISDNSHELIQRQKDFNSNIILKLKDYISKEQESKTYKTEDLLDYITMIIKDIFSIYETFRTYSIIDDLLMPSLNDIFLIFKNYYDNESNYGINKQNLSLNDSLFLINLLYNYLNICSNEFDFFLKKRINLYEKSIIDKMTETFTDFKTEIDELFNDFSTYILDKIRFDKIIKLYDYESLKKGNNIEEIKNIFNEENNTWFKIKIILHKIKADRKIYKYVETDVVKIFVDSLSQKVLNNIEKSEIEGKNLDILIDKTKFFIEDNFLTDENEITEENKKKIQKLFSYLDNLFMNKK